MQQLASDKVMESMILDHMISMFARQNQLFTREEYANKMLDGKIMTTIGNDNSTRYNKKPID